MKRIALLLALAGAAYSYVHTISVEGESARAFNSSLFRACEDNIRHLYASEGERAWSIADKQCLAEMERRSGENS